MMSPKKTCGLRYVRLNAERIIRGVRKVVRRSNRLLSPSIPRLKLAPIFPARGMLMTVWLLKLFMVVYTEMANANREPEKATHLALPG